MTGRHWTSSEHPRERMFRPRELQQGRPGGGGRGHGRAAVKTPQWAAWGHLITRPFKADGYVILSTQEYGWLVSSVLKPWGTSPRSEQKGQIPASRGMGTSRQDVASCSEVRAASLAEQMDSRG